MFEVDENAGGSTSIVIRNSAGAAKIALATAGDSYFVGGNVGIGTTNPDGKLSIVDTKSDSAIHTFKAEANNSFSATAALSNNALDINISTKVASGVTNSGGQYGAFFNSLRNFKTTSDNGIAGAIGGVQIQYGNYNSDVAATPATTNSYGLVVYPHIRTGTITNMYDIYLNAEGGGGTATNKWGFYQANSKSNYFAGNVGIGTTSPATALDVTGTIRASSRSSVYGSDATIYSNSTPNFPAGPNFLSENDSLTPGSFAGYLIQVHGNGGQDQNAYVGAVSSATSTRTPIIVIGQRLNSSSTVERLRIDENGNVGIGTTSPVVNLDIAGSNGLGMRLARFQSTTNGSNLILSKARGSIASPVIVNAGDTIGAIIFDAYEPTAGFSNGSNGQADAAIYAAVDSTATPADGNMPTNLIFKTKGASATDSSTRMVIKSDGKVGIGAWTPQAQLDILSPTLAASTPGTLEIFKISRPIDSGDSYPQTAAFALGTYSTNAVGNGYGPDTRLDINLKSTSSNDYTTDKTVMTLLDNGNVGIGTTAPGALLDVSMNGTGNALPNYPGVKIANTSTVQGDGSTTYNFAGMKVDAGNGTVSGGILASYSSTGMIDGLYFRTSTAHPLYFRTNNQNRMTIDALGNVGIGTTSPTSPVTISGAGSSSVPVLRVVNTTSNPTNVIMDAFAGAGNYVGQRANLTAGVASALASGDNIVQLGGRGYGATGYSSASRGIIGITSSEAWTDANQGAYIWFSTTPIGSTATTERMRINDSGNVGIGTTNPLTTLHMISQVTATTQPYTMPLTIEGEGSNKAGLSIAAYSDTLAPTINGYRSHGTYAAKTATQLDDTLLGISGKIYTGSNWQTPVQIRLFTTENGGGSNQGTGISFSTTKNATSSMNERMRINDSGYVGIGTTNPVNILDVQGGTAADGLSGSSISIVAQNGGATDQNGGSINLTAGAATGTGSSGQVKVTGMLNVTGTTAAIFGSSGQNMVLRRNVDDNRLIIAGGSSSTTGGNISLYGGTHSTTPNMITLLNGSNEAMRINSSGNVGIGTTSPASHLEMSKSSGSDWRLSSTDDGSFLRAVSWSGGSARIVSTVASGSANLSIDADPQDGASSAFVRVFRNTNTTGPKTFSILKGDNTSTIDSQIGVGTNSYFNISGGNVGIGTTNPSVPFQVTATSASPMSLVERVSSSQNVSIEYKNTANSIYAGLRGTTGGFAVGATGNLNSNPIFWANTSTGIEVMNGTAGLPALSGSSQSSALRLNPAGNASLDFGFNTTGTIAGWLQVTNRADLSVTNALLLNPNGGNVGMSTTLS